MVTADKMMLQTPGLGSSGRVRHGFFTRLGGVSDGIYASLNCGPGSRDSDADVAQNRALVAELLEVKPNRLFTVYQKHGAEAVVADKPWKTPPEADAIVTSKPGFAIGILTADCAPVLFCDPEASVIGAAHAGWRGTLSGILEATVAAMGKLGAEPERIVAAIGPAISQEAYEVDSEFVEQFVAQEPDGSGFFITDDGSGEPHFDLVGYVGERLARASVGTIAELGFCTYCDETRFFSYRRSQHHGEDDYGRQISAIVLA